MTKLAGLFLSANLLTTLGFPAQAWNATHLEPDARPRLTVRIYNYARVHQGTLKGAERVARQVFQQAGPGSDVGGIHSRQQRTPLSQPLHALIAF